MRVNFGPIVHGLAASVVLALLFAAGSAAAPASKHSLAPALRKDMKALVAAGVPGVVVLVRRDGARFSSRAAIRISQRRRRWV